MKTIESEWSSVCHRQQLMFYAFMELSIVVTLYACLFEENLSKLIKVKRGGIIAVSPLCYCCFCTKILQLGRIFFPKLLQDTFSGSQKVLSVLFDLQSSSVQTILCCFIELGQGLWCSVT